MNYLQDILQIVAGLGILNVWLLRFRKKTDYRGGNARSMTEEFAHYGLPGWSVYWIGFLKISAALGLLGGLIIHSLVLPSAFLLAALMVGALAMHIKVQDPAKKSLPALSMLVICLLIASLAS
jgi:hypothetical protein